MQIARQRGVQITMRQLQTQQTVQYVINVKIQYRAQLTVNVAAVVLVGINIAALQIHGIMHFQVHVSQQQTNV